MRLAQALLPILLAAPAGPPSASLIVRASPVVSPCTASAAAAFEKSTGRAVLVETAPIGPAASGDGADVVVAVEEELTRVIEGGAASPEMDLDVARIPWVLVGAGDVSRLAASGTRVRVLGGAVGREARRSLQTLPPERVVSVREAAELRGLGPGEAALVPLSLAGPGPVQPTGLAPLLVRAVGIRATPRGAAARAFLDFLAAGPGNEAFRTCGREEPR